MVDESLEPQDLPQWLRGRSGCMLWWSQTHRFLHIHSQILPVWAMVSHVQDMYVRTCVHSINGARSGALLSFMRREQSQTLSIFVAQSRHMCFRHLALKTWNRLKKTKKQKDGARIKTMRIIWKTRTVRSLLHAVTHVPIWWSHTLIITLYTYDPSCESHVRIRTSNDLLLNVCVDKHREWEGGWYGRKGERCNVGRVMPCSSKRRGKDGSVLPSTALNWTITKRHMTWISFKRCTVNMSARKGVCRKKHHKISVRGKGRIRRRSELAQDACALYHTLDWWQR